MAVSDKRTYQRGRDLARVTVRAHLLIVIGSTHVDMIIDNASHGENY